MFELSSLQALSEHHRVRGTGWLWLQQLEYGGCGAEAGQGLRPRSPAVQPEALDAVRHICEGHHTHGGGQT